MTIAVPTIIIDNGVTSLTIGIVTKPQGLSAQREEPPTARKTAQFLNIDTICKVTLVLVSAGSYVFNNAVLDSSLEFKTVSGVVFKDGAGKSNLPTYDFIAQAYGQQSKKTVW
ncbi:hypothetical protein O9992_15315 [Vibrio lentus]|nr:hypothetical protein [Vibrio lentus]